MDSNNLTVQQFNNEPVMSKRVAIIGAGIAGLACAYELQKAGHEVVVYEKNADVGGRMATRVKDGLEFNPGATFLSRHYHTLRDYSKEFGIEWAPLDAKRTHRVVRDGKAYPLGLKNPLEVLKLSVLSMSSRLRFLWFLLKLALQKVPGDFFDLSTTPDELDFDNASHHLREQVGDEVVDYIADPFTATLHFYLSDSVSTAMMLTLLKSMVGNSEFCAEYPQGGVQAIPNALAKTLIVIKNANVVSVTPAQAGVQVNVGGQFELFDAVVFACPAPAAKAMLAHPTQAQTELLASVSYGSTITLAFRVPVDLFADSTNCIYVPYVENKIISSCIFEKSKGPALVRDGKTLFNVYLHDQSAKELMGKSDAEVLATVLPELEKVCPELRDLLHKTALCTRGFELRNCPSPWPGGGWEGVDCRNTAKNLPHPSPPLARGGNKSEFRNSKTRETCDCIAPVHFHDIERWPHAMPKYLHGYVTKVKQFVQDRQGENGIYFIGDYMNSPWTEGAAQSGKRVAERIAHDLRSTTYDLQTESRS
ncbi:MAG: hypothetical protein COV10_00030 [Candidatus Vogelbacteria bacterium CG10_big_fil_rev_8_21_14_0_10_51_16]|uniref:Amine oxidase domain-containing protein n=1 Tax=Candidatus Vogelbacteria bacterium CG10_big_fil_rev_8_21_14_0_10_51_16 TaxID=1975045 RepID=A0A2H0RGW7_9BACT|nr:MAG: hypothetical protein COV10_00030 [Candidatus Vogelbacteria bacterium CG10_big_fil_rev_8_21_14_0_10_51_16]